MTVKELILELLERKGSENVLVHETTAKGQYECKVVNLEFVDQLNSVVIFTEKVAK